jgi:acyl-CoA hydrolase
MELKGSKTEEKLREAFNRELRAQAYYHYSAAAADAAGEDHIADMFSETAQNEAEHARAEFNFLYGSADLKSSLQTAIEREHEDATKLYPEAAKVAEEEGFAEIADFFRRLSNVEARHESHFHDLLEKLNKGEEFKGRTVQYSATDMAQLMLPHQANPAGFVHGGEMMKLMDNAAGVVAARHCRANPVTAMVEDIEFLSPIRITDLVIVHGKLTFVSRASMEIQIAVDVEDLLTGKMRQALTAYFVMVAIDTTGKALEVPPLIVSTEEEEQLFNEGQARYEARKARPKK